MGLFKSLTRIGSFMGKELVEVIRRPGAFFSLILGPFLVMAIFGLGFGGVLRPLDTIIVLPANAGLSTDPATYQQITGPAVHIVAVTSDEGGADRLLREQKVDLVVIAPPDLKDRFAAGQQSTLTVEFNEIDPIRASNASIMANQIASEVNRELIKNAVASGQQQLGGAASKIPPEVVAAPTVAQPDNIAQSTPTVVVFYAPAVLALVLQHLGVTLPALSLVRERLSGAIELFRVSPVTTLEILIGKYLGFGFLAAIVALALLALVVTFLHVPFLGSATFLAATLFLLGFASLGLGLFISVIADSERQAIQLSLLVLLASVFFSGFVLPLTEFTPAVQVASHVLPVTDGIRLVQDTMLRGQTLEPGLLGVLGALGVLFFLLTALRLHAQVARA